MTKLIFPSLSCNSSLPRTAESVPSHCLFVRKPFHGLRKNQINCPLIFFFFFFKILLLSQDKEQRLSVPLCSTRYCGVASLNKVLGAVMGCSFMVLEETLLLSSTLPELSSGLMLGWESDLSRSPP